MSKSVGFFFKFSFMTIQVLRQQRSGWVESENGNFCWFTVLFMLTYVGGWAYKSQTHAYVILEWSLKNINLGDHFLLKTLFSSFIFWWTFIHRWIFFMFFPSSILNHLHTWEFIHRMQYFYIWEAYRIKEMISKLLFL